MSYLLHIESAVSGASVCLSRDEEPIGFAATAEQKDSAAWLHVAIRDLLQGAALRPSDLCAVSVGSGPGSYTGLRVGFAAAKGICYALKLPLIPIGTLDALLHAAGPAEEEFRIPMIDARRMEVFLAVYDRSGARIEGPGNQILDEHSFASYFSLGKVAFFGNGAAKFQALAPAEKAVFRQVALSARDLCPLAWERFTRSEFADLAYSEPFYGKDFHSSAKQSL